MISLLPTTLVPRFIAAGAIVATLAVGYMWWASVVFDRGYNQAQSEYNQQALAASEAARQRERDYRDQLQQAQDDARRQEAAIVASVDAVRSERDRLRQALDAANRRVSRASADAVRQYAATLDDVFRQCTSRLEQMAHIADRHAADSMMLQRAWPK